MSRLIVIASLVIVAVIIFVLIDLLRIEEDRVRGILKLFWVVTIVLFLLIGSILWLVIGWVCGDRFWIVCGPIVFDDDFVFLCGLGRDKLREEIICDQEERIRKLEQELSDLDDDDFRKG